MFSIYKNFVKTKNRYVLIPRAYLNSIIKEMEYERAVMFPAGDGSVLLMVIYKEKGKRLSEGFDESYDTGVELGC